jgi:hypothetical protein
MKVRRSTRLNGPLRHCTPIQPMCNRIVTPGDFLVEEYTRIMIRVFLYMLESVSNLKYL